MLCEIDEIAHTIAAINGSKAPAYLTELAGNLLRLFSASSGVYNTRIRAAAKGTVPHRSIQRPCLNLIGFATPEKLGEALKDSNVYDGLIGRLLFAFGSETVPIRRTRKPFEMPESVSVKCAAIKSAVLALDLSGSGTNIDILIEPSAGATLWEMQTEFDRRALRAATPLSKALLMRSYEKCERICGVLAVWDNPSAPVINTAHVKWAGDLVQASDKGAAYFCGDYMHGSLVQADAALVKKTLKRILAGEFSPQRPADHAYIKSGRVPHSFVLRASKLDKRRFDDAMEHLLALVELRKERIDGQQAGGQKTQTSFYSLVNSDG